MLLLWGIKCIFYLSMAVLSISTVKRMAKIYGREKWWKSFGSTYSVCKMHILYLKKQKCILENKGPRTV